MYDYLIYKETNNADYAISNSFDGSKLASGVYFYRLQTARSSSMKKMLMIKQTEACRSQEKIYESISKYQGFTWSCL